MALCEETDINTLKININQSSFPHGGVSIVDEEDADKAWGS